MAQRPEMPDRFAPPAWPGFRKVRVSRKTRESASVTSLVLEPMDGLPLTAALPGQFVVLRLGLAPGAPAQMRSYSLSGEPSARCYRISVKREPHGVASAYIDEKVQIGDVLEMSAPRGNFTLRPGDAPVVLLSAGVGATPVIAMLHALAAEASRREVWWLYGARSGREHPFAEEVRSLLKAMAHGHSHICYSSPGPEDRPGVDFDASGRLDIGVLRELGRTARCRFLHLRAVRLHERPDRRPCGLGRRSRPHPHRVVRRRSLHDPGIAASPRRPPHLPAGTSGAGPLVSFARSGVNVHWGSASQSLLELAEACDVPTRWACRAGVCHTCETGLVAGTVALPARPDRSAGGRQRADLLFAARERRRHRSLTAMGVAMRFGVVSNGT